MGTQKMITIKNRANGIKSEIAESEWNKKKDAPEWKGVFVVVEPAPEPPEVTALKTSKKTAIKTAKEGDKAEEPKAPEAEETNEADKK